MTLGLCNNDSISAQHKRLLSAPRGDTNVVTVVKKAPKVCPAPKRTKSKNVVDTVSARKGWNSRLESLARPTVSSLAKIREKASSRKNYLATEKTPTKKPKKSKKTSSSLAKNVPRSMITNPETKSVVKSTLCEKMIEDLAFQTPQRKQVLDKIEVNPLLIDADDFFFEPFTHENVSPSACCSLITSANPVPCNFERENSSTWTSFFSVSHTATCAVGFAAGVGVGMALGACSILTLPPSI